MAAIRCCSRAWCWRARNRSPEQGIWTAEEVADLDLRGVELAVLSACETGLGKVAGGEGVLGLQCAFQSAGARSLVVSLWKVNDAATSVLMEEFYTNLWQKKLDRLEALCQAQLTVLRQPARVLERQKLLGEELVSAVTGAGRRSGPASGRRRSGEAAALPPASGPPSSQWRDRREPGSGRDAPKK